jgi:hypothetical protein
MLESACSADTMQHASSRPIKSISERETLQMAEKIYKQNEHEQIRAGRRLPRERERHRSDRSLGLLETLCCNDSRCDETSIVGKWYRVPTVRVVSSGVFYAPLKRAAPLRADGERSAL